MKVSIITACYNSEKSILSALKSVEEQNYPDIEHIIVDGASTDDTLGIVQQFESTNISLVSEPDEGIYDALNKGIARSAGDVIGFLHSDDRFANSQSVSSLLAYIRKGQVGVYSDLKYIGAETGRTVRHWRAKQFQPHFLSRGWMPPHPTLFLNSQVYKELGGFDTSYTIAADYEFVLKLFARYGSSIGYLPKVEVLMATGGVSNRSFRNILLKMKEDARAMSNHDISPFRGLLMKNLTKIPQFLGKI